ncbi:MAG: MerR family transcriptional regulator, partial [Myxococcota bacterium]
MSDTPKYRIQAVAEATGVPTATLRAWERRYGVPSPKRAGNQYRLYSEEDISLIRRMALLCSQGTAPSQAAKIVMSETPRTVAATEPGNETGSLNPYSEAVDRIVDAASKFDSWALDREIQRGMYLGPALTVYRQVLAPAMQRLGQQWEDGETGVAEEHFASQALMGAVRNMVRLSQRPDAESQILLGCVANEDHELPLYGVAIMAAQSGWRPMVLGARTPPDAVASAVKQVNPEAVGLSITIEQTNDSLTSLFGEYAQACGRTPWVVGGRASTTYRHVIEAAGGGVAGTDPDAITEFLKQARTRLAS